MAHEKFYATCENKCRVDITDKVVADRFILTFDNVYQGTSSAIATVYYDELITSDSLNSNGDVTINNIDGSSKTFVDGNMASGMIVMGLYGLPDGVTLHYGFLSGDKAGMWVQLKNTSSTAHRYVPISVVLI